ncbi:MAG TPA: serine hydrolase [Candidatus Saccharimonadales bacterium]|nr:serine hydrolase [Candidatus Saccharimonadales bacterium]
MKATDIATQLAEDYKTASFVVTTDDTRTKVTLRQLGGAPQAQTAADAAVDYPFMVRIIPFSAAYIMFTRDAPVRVSFTGDELAAFAAKLEQTTQREAVNATIAVKDDEARVVSAVPRKVYEADATVRTLRAASFADNTPIKLQPKTTPAQRTDAMVRPLIDSANRAIDVRLQLDIAGKASRPKATEIAAWLHFPEDSATKELSLALKQDAVAAYLAKVQGDAYIAPGKTMVRSIDGREVSRVTGKSGKGVDAAAALPALLTALQAGGEQRVDLPVGTISPEIVYERVHSNADAAFTSVVQQAAQAKGGFGIAVMEMNGRSSNANGDKQFVAASTYKLYVAYMWFKRVEAGKASWSDSINGQRADRCFEVMIVNSDNPCAIAFAQAVGGWDTVDAGMKDLGLQRTSLVSGNLRTTANDLAYFMYRLEQGNLVAPADRTRLINLMKRQIYRSGIPAGTGVSVANKVGFVDGYLNDPAIVYSPKGTYIMVIMSYGSTWSQVADAAKQIHAYLQ